MRYSRKSLLNLGACLVTAAALARTLPAAACEWCYDALDDGTSDVDAPPAANVRTPAVVTKAPALDREDVSFLLSLDGGRRYVRRGDYIVDKKVRDPWMRLLAQTQVLDLLSPRSARLAAGLRERAASGRLGPGDGRLAAHLFRDIPSTIPLDDVDLVARLARESSTGEPEAPVARR